MRTISILILLLLAFVLNISVMAGQQPYSESFAYEARVFGDAKKRKGKKPKPIALTAGDLLIPVAVMDRTDNFITSLTKDDLTVFLDDSPVDIIGIEEAKNTPANIVLLFDASPSIEPLLKSISKLAAVMINDLSPNDRMMIATFDQTLSVRQEFTSDKAQLAKSLKKVRFGSGTSIYDTVGTLIRNRLAAPRGRTYVIFFTDGVDTTSRTGDFESSLIEAERGTATFIPIYLDTFQLVSTNQRRPLPIGFPPIPIPGSFVSRITQEAYTLGRDYLNDLAVATGGRTFIFSSESDEQQVICTTILGSIRSTYMVRVQRPPNSENFKRYSIRVRIAKPNMRVYATGSYLAGY